MATGTSTAATQRVRAPWLKWTALGVGAGAALASSAAGAVSGLAVYFARQIVTPARRRDENLEILAVVGQAGNRTVILPANEDTTIEGTYSLHFDGGSGHARVGAIRSYVPREGRWSGRWRRSTRATWPRRPAGGGVGPSTRHRPRWVSPRRR
ncbi:hypothetical protein MN0502_18390 [Arthrobacter sp. MN05-02]|nr:hypothetical protein MN0502_18390 [Arthrobacter sp. MN05-02]